VLAGYYNQRKSFMLNGVVGARLSLYQFNCESPISPTGGLILELVDSLCWCNQRGHFLVSLQSNHRLILGLVGPIGVSN